MQGKSPILLTPGPVSIAPATWAAIGQPAIHQRSPEFQAFFANLQTGLRYLFQTAEPVLTLAGSGTMGMEITMRSLLFPGDKVIVQEYGKFSQRWRIFAEELGLEVISWAVPWRSAPSVEEARTLLAQHPDAKAWVLTHVETSTGMAIDLEEIAFAIREAQPEQLVVVDGICSVGIQALYLDAWGLDAVVAASQKGLANPAGTSFVALSPRARAVMGTASLGNAQHLFPYWDYLERGSYPFTPPVNLFFGLNAVLAQVQEQGLPAQWHAIQARKRAFDQAIVRLGGQLAGAEHGLGLSVFSFPGRDHVALQAQLHAEYGIVVANGQAELRGKILRVGHFGAISMAETEACIEAFNNLIPKSKA